MKTWNIWKVDWDAEKQAEVMDCVASVSTSRIDTPRPDEEINHQIAAAYRSMVARSRSAQRGQTLDPFQPYFAGGAVYPKIVVRLGGSW